MRYLITGGGTGGHIYPALAIANEIKNTDKDAKILYLGTEKGLESELVPKAGFDFKTIRVKGMPRKINKESFLAAKELLHGIADSKKIIKEFKPDIVIGTGGYVCGPVVYIAAKKRIKTMIHEQNAFPGITNKILSRYVDRVAVTFDEAKKYFKYPDRVINTGNPIRKEIVNVNKDNAYKTLGIDKNIPFVLSFGGSGGQKKLNDSMYFLIKEGLKNEDIQIIHVTGKRFYDEFMTKLRKDNIILNEKIKVIPYLYEVPEALNIASIVVASSGAITLAEISAIGVPSILIPKAYTAENHQEFNARAFEDKGASIVILEKDLINTRLNDTVYDLIKDKNKLSNMAMESKSLGKINASKKIIDEIQFLLER
jgi:UDP-N-acetylglucosamine--N-acetylmuramyl-(pentapeptide) pyrophosphoryl-undecaprenol N-acetylglucosamine transferase